MSSRRTAKAAEAIRETVSSTILFELKDPRVKNVTVIAVSVADDLRTAKVYVSIMGDEKTQSLCLHGLNSARGFLQAKIADRLQTKYTPVLTFVVDQGVKRSIEASRILNEVLPGGASQEIRDEDVSDGDVSGGPIDNGDGPADPEADDRERPAPSD